MSPPLAPELADPTSVLVGRSSSHFTRIARIFAFELGVPHAFRVVSDLTTPDPAAYAGNPALKIPIWIDERGPLFGTENICRELVRRSDRRAHVILRGDVADRVVANAEELVLHAMTAEVTLIMSAALNAPAGNHKVRPSLENALAYLEAHVDDVLAALSADRTLSFCETSLYCLVTHLPFRKVMEVTAYPRLQAFAAVFGQRPSARATEFRFDT